MTTIHDPGDRVERTRVVGDTIETAVRSHVERCENCERTAAGRSLDDAPLCAPCGTALEEAGRG